MPRAARAVEAGLVYHVFNHCPPKSKLFRRSEEFDAFIELLREGKQRASVEVLGFCLMPDHWHLVVRPRRARDLSDFVRWVSTTHGRRFERSRGEKGRGCVYAGRFRSFPVQEGEPLLKLMRHVEGNAQRRKLVERAEDWKWSSLAMRQSDEDGLLDRWPVKRPAGWERLVNRGLEEQEREQIKTSIFRGRPLGEARWVLKTAERMGLMHTLRPRGRPRKEAAASA